MTPPGFTPLQFPIRPESGKADASMFRGTLRYQAKILMETRHVSIT